MRTLPFIALVGCNSFTTVQEACLPEAVPGADAVTRDSDLTLLERANCYRRLANRPRAKIHAGIQGSVEGHRDWLELNAPHISPMVQRTGTEGFTGTSAALRLDAEGYTMPPDSALLQFIALAYGPLSQQLPVGADYFDFMFEDPFVRATWLQPTVFGMGAAEATYTLTYPEGLGFPDEPVHASYWNIVHGWPATPYAEPAVVYPRNGQTDVPPDYVHINDVQGALEVGATYGFPISFTVGSAERDVEFTQASLVGPNGPVPFIAVTGISTAGFLQNTAILVPEEPLQTGATYTARARISSNLGERAARSEFTVGGTSRPVPGLARQAARQGLPAYALIRLDPAQLGEAKGRPVEDPQD